MDKDGLRRLLERHTKRRPLMKARDVYKLIYQGVFGVGHILDEGAFLRLREEAERVSGQRGYDDPLFESVSPDGSIVRVNLRPYLREGYPLEALYEAMMDTGNRGDPEKFRELWLFFKKMVEVGELDFDMEEIDKLEGKAAEEPPEPMHHTCRYREAYYPAYRVVGRDAIERALGELI